MTTKLEAIRATREFLHRAPVRRLRENRTRDWGDCVDVEQSDFDLLLAVAEAAAAYAHACAEIHRIGGDYGEILNTPIGDRERLGMSEDAARRALRTATDALDDAEEALLVAVAPLMEEETE